MSHGSSEESRLGSSAMAGGGRVERISWCAWLYESNGSVLFLGRDEAHKTQAKVDLSSFCTSIGEPMRSRLAWRAMQCSASHKS
jgi:hypothetical protein